MRFKFDYDGFDRVTQETFPDDTTRQFCYKWLDLASATKRQRRITQYTYDAVRNLDGSHFPACES